jgi:peptidoglycan pentaglycine glycine transferase (the first glycine)
MSSQACAPDRWSAWDRFLETMPRTGFMQSSAWADFRTAVGFEHFGVVLKHPNAIAGGAIVQKCSCSPQSCFYYIQDGPVLPADPDMAGEVFEAILHEIEERRKRETQVVSHLRIEPRWQHVPDFVSDFRPPPSEDNFMEPRNTLLIDLRPPVETILAGMKPKGRYNIRVAQRHGVTVVEDTSDQGLADFQQIYEEMAVRQRIEAKPPEYFETLIFLFSSEGKATIFFAEYDRTRIAAALVLYFGEVATYFFGGSLDIHRNTMAPYALQFQIMCKAKALGYKWYDLWGIAPCTEPNDPWQKISVFKRKFGGLEISFVPALDHVYDHAAYDEYVRTAGDT